MSMLSIYYFYVKKTKYICCLIEHYNVWTIAWFPELLQSAYNAYMCYFKLCNFIVNMLQIFSYE